MQHHLVLILTLFCTCCTGFRESKPGVFGAPSTREEQMISRINEYRIKSVLCLRGGQSVRQSKRATLAANAAFIHVPISAKSLPHPDALLAIWQVAVAAERPVMVHCRAGVDRTGLALALIALHDTGSLSTARVELAFTTNWHLKAFGTEAMDQVLDQFEPFSGIMSFPSWVDRVYRIDYEAKALTAR